MRIVFGAICFVMMMSASAGAEELRPKLDDMVRHFANVVFGSEYSGTGKLKGIPKWTGPVGITVQGKPTEQLAEMASKHLSTLAGLTKVKFKQVKPGTKMQTIDMLFLRRQDMAQLKVGGGADAMIQKLSRDPTMRCFFLTWTNDQSRLVKGIIVINVELDPAVLNACMLEELSQTMGLRNDVDTYWTSIFRPNDTSTELSPWDKIYLKTLYDPRIKAGMKPVDALHTAKGIFAEAMAKIP